MIDFLTSNSIFGSVTWGEFFYMASMLLFMFILSMVLESIDRKRRTIILFLFFSIQLISGMIIFGRKIALFELFFILPPFNEFVVVPYSIVLK